MSHSLALMRTRTQAHQQHTIRAFPIRPWAVTPAPCSQRVPDPLGEALQILDTAACNMKWESVLVSCRD